MESIQAIQEAVVIAGKIKKALRADLAENVTDDFLTIEFWMDRIRPEACFLGYAHLTGFVYCIIINHVTKDEKG